MTVSSATTRQASSIRQNSTDPSVCLYLVPVYESGRPEWSAATDGSLRWAEARHASHTTNPACGAGLRRTPPSTECWAASKAPTSRPPLLSASALAGRAETDV